jgi:hypothetical protein
MDILAGSYISSIRRIPSDFINNVYYHSLSYALIGGIQCVRDDAWFYDIVCVGSLK